MIKYEMPDMAVIEAELIREYEAFASSTGGCTTASSVTCTGSGGVNICSANVSGCGSASYCTTKSQ